MIDIRDLKIPYIDKTINMKIFKECNLLTGANGDGKTLLLDYLSGVRKCNKNCISGNESILYINQNIYFSDRLSGWDFLKFVYGIDRMVSLQMFYRLSDFVMSKEEIDGLLKKQWGMLSGGEKKFLYTIILLSLDREWYILDEPFAYVDKKRKKFLNRLIEIKLSEDKGIILTTHEEDEWLLNSVDTILTIK